MNNGNEESAPKSNSLWGRFTPKQVQTFLVIVMVISISIFIVGSFYEEEQRRRTTIPYMDFTVLNLTETSLSVKWDLVIRIPSNLPGYDICLKGDFQAFILYKGVTIANTSLESYNLIPNWPQLLNASLIASEGDMDKVVVKDIMEDIKERSGIRFRSQWLFPDCGSGRKRNYTCDESALRFEHGSQRKATMLGNHAPVCHYVH